MMADIPEELIGDCAQLVKANSIMGNVICVPLFVLPLFFSLLLLSIFSSTFFFPLASPSLLIRSFFSISFASISASPHLHHHLALLYIHLSPTPLPSSTPLYPTLHLLLHTYTCTSLNLLVDVPISNPQSHLLLHFLLISFPFSFLSLFPYTVSLSLSFCPSFLPCLSSLTCTCIRPQDVRPIT